MNWNALPILGVRDVANLRDYFTDTLGFTCTSEHVPAGEMVYAIVEREGAQIHIQIRRGPQPVERQDHETDAFLLVSDVNAIYIEFKARGVALHRDIQDEPYGMRDFTIRLPGGLRVAFASPIDSTRYVETKEAVHDFAFGREEGGPVEEVNRRRLKGATVKSGSGVEDT